MSKAGKSILKGLREAAYYERGGKAGTREHRFSAATVAKLRQQKKKGRGAKKKYKSDAIKAAHDIMCGLYSTGAISKKRMQEFDKLCSVSPPRQKKSMRKKPSKK